MSIRIALRHKTHYRYNRRITLGPQVVRLRPAPHSRTHVTSYSLRVSPEAHFLNWQQDPQGNFLARLVFTEPTDHLDLDVELIADLKTLNPFDFFLEPDAETFPFSYDEESLRELAPCLEKTATSPRLEELVRSLDPIVRRLAPQRIRTIDFLVALNQVIHDRVKYVIRLEPGVQIPEETLQTGKGSCRDSAWLFVQLLRRFGLAARFASGYLIQLKADEKPLEGPKGPEQDFTDLHAWAEVFLPGAGWVGLDATSGLFTAEGHIPLACTPEPGSAAPLSGALDDCKVEFEHHMQLERIHETPRVTLPYTDAVWRRIETLGQRIDRDLTAADVRLTQGGEPTFVSLDDRDAHEWNYGALGTQKRNLAGILFRRLARRFAKDPLLLYGQGKWYPGEQLPRWALGCYFRKDGDSIWTHSELYAEDGHKGSAGPKQAEKFIERLAARLLVDASCVLPAYEDAFHYMLSERRLPTNVTPFDNRLDDPSERERMARVLEQGLSKVIGYVLPLTPNGRNGWRSGAWFLRREFLYLIPGDSAMGYRLPVDSLPWLEETDYPYLHERDPFAPRGPLPPYVRDESPGQILLQASHDPAGARPPRPFESVPGVVRTALCVEPRAGILHLFLPPVERLEDYLDLLRRVEDVAVELGQPVRLEGYAPPTDHRLEKFSVTPDPGVIEVNIHPSGSWEELVRTTTALYEEARACRLGTEKFMLDGRHAGTGGGNHVTLGGPSPADSPMLRRPDLLASLVGYWHDHPSLSFLFSGLFIGPTSQAPRADEARHEASFELETAFSEVRRLGLEPGGVAPWLVDRIFRNLLADVTGNTHRAEFCIDKLYSPDSASGRLGLLEMRGFEMPPHARMSLAQTLLVRGLLSRFWKKPYISKVVRWGTSLHDRFMLPYFVWQDFKEVLRELGEAGYPFEEAWFTPHFEFRFPTLGSVTYDAVELELRRALEPWHVLAEEAGPSGTARNVDASLDRIQVLLRGATPGRHQVICNGARVPLHPTGTRGEAVAGVRFRAWPVPSALHPTIGVHAPLELAVLDEWSERALGGCRLQVSHPGGLAHERFPVNALEAEARRAALFVPFGHPPGGVDMTLLVDPRTADYPLTLDLRRLNVGSSRPGQLW